MRRRLLCVLVLGAVALAAACAPKRVALPTVLTPAFPEFMQPDVPPDLAVSPAADNQQRAWVFLQAGDVKNADREVEAALKAAPDFYPAEATGGYVELAQKNARNAVSRFDRALERRADYVPALLGKGQALAALNRDPEAIAAFEAALKFDPLLTDVARRVEVLRFRGLQRDLDAAREAARAGRTEDAIREYKAAIASSPDSAFLYRELGVIERKHGDTEAALADFRKAGELDPADAASFVQIGEMLHAAGDLPGALQAFETALAIEPDEGVQQQRDAVRAETELAALPESYRAIAGSAQLTRAELAALIGVRLSALLPVSVRDIGVVTDVRGNWAEPWIFPVLRAGIMEPLPNHAFQPAGIVRRVDFAQVIERLLARVAAVVPARAQAWRDARVTFPDIGTTHIAYPAASASVASGVLATTADGSFQPARVVTGAEAIAAIERIEQLANIRTGPQTGRR